MLSLDVRTAAFIRRLPKTETHLHIEGALPYELLRSLDPVRFAADPVWWDSGYRYADFRAFEDTLIAHAMLWYRSPERYHQAASVVFRGLLERNVRYVETSFHLPMAAWMGAGGEAIVDAIRSAAPPGLVVRVFAGMLRNDWSGPARPLIESVHTWEHLAGIDLHGVEGLPLEVWTAPIWERARAHGKVTKAHAGEFGGPDSVREVVEILGVRRIQHGVRAVEDPDVVRLLAEHDATCDVCPISNLKLQVVPSLREHPLPRLVAAGVRCTVSTDDPFSFGNTIEDEYAVLHAEMGFGRSALARTARAGFEVALVDETTRGRWLAELDEVAATA